MATTLTFADLPRPGSDDHKWTSIYKQFTTAGDVEGYLNYLQTQRSADWSAWLKLHPSAGTGGVNSGGTAGGGPGTATMPGGLGVAFPGLTPQQIMTLSPSQVDALAAQSYTAGLGLSGAGAPAAGGGGGTGTGTTGGTNGGTGAGTGGGAGGTPTGSGTGAGSGAGGGAPGGNGGAPGGVPGGGAGGGQGPGAGGYGGHGGGDWRGTGGNRSLEGGSAGGIGLSGQGGANGTPSSGLIDFGGAGSGLIDLGTAGSTALALAGFLPGWAGTAMGLANLAGRAYNTATVDGIRGDQGLPSLDFGQWVGSLAGLNNYGGMGGNTTIANPSQFTDRMNGLLADNRLYSGGALPGSSLAETNNGDPYNSFRLFGIGLGTETPALSYGMTQQLLDRIRTGQAIPYDTPTTYAPTGVMNVPKPGGLGLAAPAGGVPITRADGTVIGYMNADGTATTAAAQASLGDPSAYGTRGAATTAAMGGGWNGSQSAPGSRIGSGTGLTGGGQGERAGF